MVKRGIFLLLLILAFSSLAEAVKEEVYQDRWCAEHNGINGDRPGMALADGTRVDCFMEAYAIEFDFAHKWAESIGQALYYALETGMRPGVVLIMGPGDERYLKRLQDVAGKYGIKVWTVKK